MQQALLKSVDVAKFYSNQFIQLTIGMVCCDVSNLSFAGVEHSRGKWWEDSISLSTTLTT